MEREPVLRMSGVQKRFGRTVALDGVDLEVCAGEVHALLGENGAGKSTLMKVLSGAHRPDAGALELAGRPFAPADPGAARRAGVAIVYQEPSLAPHLSVEENLTLGLEGTRCGIVRRSAWRARVAEVLARLRRPEIVPGARVSGLAPAARQLVEIARALMTEARVLVLDEPTSSLGREDVRHLFEVVRGLTAEGVAVIYVSHFLEEVFEIGARYTVLRDGRTVRTGELAGTRLDELIEAMIGRRLEQRFPRVPHEVGEVLLEVEDASSTRAGLTLRRGEILGLAGLVGAGRTELLRAIAGLDQVRGLRVRLAGQALEDGAHRRLARGLGLASEDRAGEGLALARTVEENLTLSRLAPYARAGWLRLGRLFAAAQAWTERLDVRGPALRTAGAGAAAGLRRPVRELSGGNQQKVALARLLHQDADVLLLDEPTRGIDVASKAEVYRLIGELAARGKALLVASSATPELLGICDRIAVMHRGRIVATRPAGEWTEHALLACAASGREEAA